MTLVAGCGDPTPTTPVEIRVVAPDPTPTPLIARAAGVYTQTNERGDVVGVLMYVLPTEPGLVVRGAPDGELDRVVAKLAAFAPRLDTLTSDQTANPADDPSSPMPAAQDTFSRAATIVQILVVDAGRLWNAGSYDAAAARLAVATSIASDLVAHGGAVPATRPPMLALLRLESQLSAGLASKINADSRRTLRAALDRFQPNDPDGSVARWESNAREAASLLRTELAGADAGKRLAATIDLVGADVDDVAGVLPGNDSAAFKGMIPVRTNLSEVRSLSAKKITRHIDDAEALIKPIAVALREGGHRDEILRLQGQAAADPSQVARLILGAPAATGDNARRFSSMLVNCKHMLGGEGTATPQSK